MMTEGRYIYIVSQWTREKRSGEEEEEEEEEA